MRDRLSSGGNERVTNFLLFIASSDPLSMGPQKALETIGANLQKQYENWQPRVSALYLLFSFFLTGKLQFLGFKQPLSPSGGFCGPSAHVPRWLDALPCTLPAGSVDMSFFVCEGGQALGWTVSYSFGLSFPPQSFDTESISHVTLKSWFFFCTGNIFSVTFLQSQLVRAISPSSVFKQLRRKHSALKGWRPGRALSLMQSSGSS